MQKQRSDSSSLALCPGHSLLGLHSSALLDQQCLFVHFPVDEGRSQKEGRIRCWEMTLSFSGISDPMFLPAQV